MTRRGMLILGAVVVFASALAIAVIAIEQMRDSARSPEGSVVTSPSGGRSPYDMTELSGDLDLDRLQSTFFVSVLVSDSGGRLVSYMVDDDGAAAKALIEAVRGAKQMELADLPASARAKAAASQAEGAEATALASSLTFVLPSRQTVTFALDLSDGLLFRGGGVWRPGGDLNALIAGATTAPAVP